MGSFFSKYGQAILGSTVALVFIALSSWDIILEDSSKLESSLISVFIGFGVAIIFDLSERREEFRRTLEDILKKNLNDNAKVLEFPDSDYTYSYLTKRIQSARCVYNTIIHKEAYDKDGINPKTKESLLFNYAKLKGIKNKLFIWEDIISECYSDYGYSILKENDKNYTCFTLDADLAIFQNFTVMVFENDIMELVIGWIVVYDTITRDQPCYLISNQKICKHYLNYFNTLKLHQSSRLTKSSLSIKES